ncbi:MAG: uracil phosphoribosyltransferase [Phycisphaerales bacterium]|nr:uracil phosphoribosyltransferase [Phycisphaerales bacterium]
MNASSHPNLTILDHPLIQDKMARLRDESTTHEDFRRLIGQVAGLMTFQASRDLPVTETNVRTPLEDVVAARLSAPVTLVPILRAGLGMVEGIVALMSEANVGHIGLYRDESTLKPVTYYCKLPAMIAEGPVFLVDPMLATGGSAIAATEVLQTHGCKDIRLICLVAAPEGVEAMAEAHPGVRVFVAALDRELNDVGYILPGLGDAGDRIFGTR